MRAAWLGRAAFLLWCLAAAAVFGVGLVGTVLGLVVAGQAVELVTIVIGRLSA